jgi:hypothetical protein
MRFVTSGQIKGYLKPMVGLVLAQRYITFMPAKNQKAATDPALVPDISEPTLGKDLLFIVHLLS